MQPRSPALAYLLLAAVALMCLGDLERPGVATAEPCRPRMAAPSRAARADIPRAYLTLYQQADCHSRVPWTVLAAIGKVESDHGRLRLPGVRSGLNRYRDRSGRWRSCCAGPMQFNLVNGPPSTWDVYGRGSPYDPADAIPAAARLLVANGVRRNVDKAIYSYNHSWAYVRRVKALARRYQARRS